MVNPTKFEVSLKMIYLKFDYLIEFSSYEKNQIILNFLLDDFL